MIERLIDNDKSELKPDETSDVLLNNEEEEEAFLPYLVNKYRVFLVAHIRIWNELYLITMGSIAFVFLLRKGS